MAPPEAMSSNLNISRATTAIDAVIAEIDRLKTIYIELQEQDYALVELLGGKYTFTVLNSALCRVTVFIMLIGWSILSVKGSTPAKSESVGGGRSSAIRYS